VAGVVLIAPNGEREYVFDDEIATKTQQGYRAPDDGTAATYQRASGSESRVAVEDLVGEAQAGGVAGVSGGEAEAGAFADRRAEEDFGGFGGGAAALGLGAARGATFGLSDFLVDEEYARGYAAENPGLDLVGTIGGGLVTGGVTGLSKGALSVGKALAPGSRAAAAMIAGTTEGMAFGAGQATSALILKNEPLTAESVFAEYGADIFLGGAFGAGGGLVGHGLERAGGKLLGRAEGKLSRLADDVDPEKALAANSDLPTAVPLDSARGKVLTEDFVGGLQSATSVADELAAAARTGNAVDLPPETFVRSFRLTRQWLDDNLETAVARAQAGELPPDVVKVVQSTQRKARRLYSELDGPMDALGRPKVAQRGGTNATDGLDDVTKRQFAKKLVEYRNLARDFEKHGLGPGMGVGEPVDEVLALERFAANESTAKFAPEVAEYAASYEAGRKTLFEKLMVRGTTPKKRQLEVFAEMSAPEAVEVAQAYSAMAKNADALAASLGSDFSVQAAKLTEELGRVRNAIGSIAKRAPGAEAGPSGGVMETMVALGLIDQVMPDIDGPADELLTLWLAAKVGKTGAIGAAAKKAASGAPWINRVLRAGARGGAFRSAAKGVGGGIKGGVAGAASSSLAGSLVDNILGNTSGLAKSTSKAVARTEQVVGKLIKTAGKTVRKAAPFAPKAFLENIRFADIEHPKGTSAFEQRAAEIRANVANSYGVQKSVLRNLGDLAMTHPGVADKTIAHADRNPGTVMRLGRSAWKASEQDIAKFARYTRAALDPDGELERFADLDLSPEGAEALRVLYPAKFAKFQEYIAANLPALQDKLSHPEQVQMSILFAVPVTSSMEPANVRASQATFAADATSQPVSQPPPGSGGATPLSPAQELLTR
jgi:hypothetical protein